jgi:hypothetical protein
LPFESIVFKLRENSLVEEKIEKLKYTSLARKISMADVSKEAYMLLPIF